MEWNFLLQENILNFLVDTMDCSDIHYFPVTNKSTIIGIERLKLIILASYMKLWNTM